ncbi:MAG: tRNA preQ1(34) S-adenosylmethionine ribosyltransferase-isomerase QueA [Bacillota bacterium]|nr:tRNA preQ1(34) S-adenosylmethionine ribosyltransferase-isomerase QueA [Bacillota bacterium]
MNVSDFKFDLPERLIAQTPIKNRDESRLLILDRNKDTFEHRHFKDITEYLKPGDVLVLNDSKVLPARIFGERSGTGAHVEFVLLKHRENDVWECLVKPGRRAKTGDRFTFGERLSCEIVDIIEEGIRLAKFSYEGSFYEILDEIGNMPLPPYIKEKLEDKSRYQTVYARELGSAAAPTAGLHFTPELLKRISDMGVEIVYVTLHVGLGTFRPVKAHKVENHQMHSEYYTVPQATADAVNAAKAEGRRVIAVGTTSCRTLESAADKKGHIVSGGADTHIFIYPGYDFRILDGLITNFHLPESTLIMLVSALAGRDRILKAYSEAVRLEYRFFSFGDAMFII